MAKEKKDFHIGIRICALVILFLTLVSFFELGIIGFVLNNIFSFLFGKLLVAVVYLLLLFLSIYMLYTGKILPFNTPEFIGTMVVLLAGLIIACYEKDSKGFSLIATYLKSGNHGQGGFIGISCYGFLSTLFDSTGALWFSIILILVGIVLLCSKLLFSPNNELDKLEEKAQKFKDKRDERKAKKEEKKQTIIPVKNNRNTYSNTHKTLFFDENTFEDQEETYLEDDIVNAFAFDKPTTELELNEEEMKLEVKEKDIQPIVTPIKKSGSYKLPSANLLNKIPRNNNQTDERRNARNTGAQLEEVMRNFGVNVHVEDIQIGPSVTKYELRLEIGTRVNKILSLQDDIQLALAAKDIRIEAPIPGKPYVGIEVPNRTTSMVPYNEIFQLAKRDSTWNNKLAVPLGKDVSGKLIVSELDKMPHLLIAGATGSGKSVCVNSIITSILMKAKPDEVKLLLVDPKKVELSNYNSVPHLLTPVVTDPKKAAGSLQVVVSEMEQRYEVFSQCNVRNINGYNRYVDEYNLNHDDKKERMHYIVVILDEVADLMMVASKVVEDCIMRLAQMARAAGIHMIVATQRPSTDIITGVIKANIPSRIAFAVSSSIDSRTILDASGAEKLLGKGDMLFSPMGSSSPIRVQGAYVDDKEVERVVDFVSHQQEAVHDEKYEEAMIVASGSNSEDVDEEYEDCREFVILQQKASTSLLQRRFKIGYNKAARIMEQLEANGVIGPANGSKPREVYIKPTEEE